MRAVVSRSSSCSVPFTAVLVLSITPLMGAVSSRFTPVGTTAVSLSVSAFSMTISTDEYDPLGAFSISGRWGLRARSVAIFDFGIITTLSTCVVYFFSGWLVVKGYSFVLCYFCGNGFS